VVGREQPGRRDALLSRQGRNQFCAIQRGDIFERLYRNEPAQRGTGGGYHAPTSANEVLELRYNSLQAR